MVEQEAALDLELRVEQALDLGERHRGVHGRVVDVPPVRGPRPEDARVGLGQVDADVLEAERRVDAVADRLQDLVDREGLGEARGHLKQLLERGPVAGGLLGLLGALDRDRGVVGHRHEHVQLLVGRDAPARGLVDRQDADQVAVGLPQRHEQRVERMPAVRRRSRPRRAGRTSPARASPSRTRRAARGRRRGARSGRRAAAPTPRVRGRRPGAARRSGLPCTVVTSKSSHAGRCRCTVTVANPSDSEIDFAIDARRPPSSSSDRTTRVTSRNPRSRESASGS